MENNTAKHFVLQLGSLITLYLSLSFLIVLLFSIINLMLPDAAEGYWQIESASSTVRLSIAMLIVFFPTYLVLTRKVNTLRRQESNHAYLGLTKWLIYLSLLVGGGVLLGDLVATILAFLNGELTTRFLLKAGVLLVVVGAAFNYYLQDARGYWLSHEKTSIKYAYAMIVVVLAALVTGFFFTETPAEVREMRLDEKQVQDLREIQWQIEEEIDVAGNLPATLDAMYGEFPVPEAPEGRDDYTYEVTENGFRLCATFAHDSIAKYEEYLYQPNIESKVNIKNADDWSYLAGRHCFERVVSQRTPVEVN